MNGFRHRCCRTLVATAVLLLGSCGQDAVHSPEAGIACDPCGSGVDFASLLRGVQSTCGARLTCVVATFSLPGPGVCINASGDTTCQGTHHRFGWYTAQPVHLHRHRQPIPSERRTVCHLRRLLSVTRQNAGRRQAAEQADEADEAFGGTVASTKVPPHARAGQVGRGHRFAAYPRCSADVTSSGRATRVHGVVRGDRHADAHERLESWLHHRRSGDRHFREDGRAAVHKTSRALRRCSWWLCLRVQLRSSGSLCRSGAAIARRASEPDRPSSLRRGPCRVVLLLGGG